MVLQNAILKLFPNNRIVLFWILTSKKPIEFFWTLHQIWLLNSYNWIKFIEYLIICYVLTLTFHHSKYVLMFIWKREKQRERQRDGWKGGLLSIHGFILQLLNQIKDRSPGTSSRSLAWVTGIWAIDPTRNVEVSN